MSKGKLLKRTGIFILSSIILVFIAWQIIKEFKVKAFVVDSLQAELNQYFEDSVQLKIEGISFQFLKKEISLENIEVELIGEQTDTIAFLTLPKLNFQWSDYWESFYNYDYKFKLLQIKNAKVMLPLDFENIKRNKASKPSFDGKFELQIQEFNLKDGEIEFYHKKNGKSGSIKSKYDLRAKDLHFEKGEIPKSFQDVASEIFLEFRNLTYHLKDNFHRLDIENLSFDLFQQHLTVNSAHFKPLYSAKKFAELKGEQVNYIDILLDSIQISSINWQGDSMLSASSIFAQNIKLDVIKDKNYVLPNDRFVPVLIEELKQSKFSIDLRELMIRNLDLIYHEIPEGETEKGIVTITNINGDIKNITNRKDSIKKHGSFLVIETNGKLYNEGRLSADIRYNLNSKYGYFSVAGKLEPMPISHINQYLSKSYPVEISSGNVDELFFSYSGGNRAVSGEMEFKYSDLKIKFHKVLNEEEKGDKALSWLANVALSQDNPRNNGRFRVGKIKFKRDTRKSMFSYWSNSLVSGFQSTVGMNKPARIEKLKNEKEDKNLWQKIGLGKEEESE